MGWTLDAIAWVVVGGTSLSGGRGKTHGTMVGALVNNDNRQNLLDVNTSWQARARGPILDAVAIDMSTRRR